MADVAELTGGRLRDWLAAQRPSLNARFRLAQRRFPRLEPAATLQLMRQVLQPLAGDGEPGTAELLSTVYDLILLHAGRGTVHPGGGSLSGIRELLLAIFPKIQHLLRHQPRYLPAALSNAVEKLGRNGQFFARQIGTIAEHVDRGELLLDAGAVLAWRLGEPRLRARALEVCGRLPSRAILLALCLDRWPDAAAPFAVWALTADAWRHPDGLFMPHTLDRLASASTHELATWQSKVSAPPVSALQAWKPVRTVGDFRGFDGQFDEPPLLLNAGDENSRHRLHVRSGRQTFVVEADIFGWVSLPIPLELQTAKLVPRRGKLAAMLGGTQNRDRPILFIGGTFELSGQSLQMPAFARASSFSATADRLAFTNSDSFRIRIVTPGWQPL